MASAAIQNQVIDTNDAERSLSNFNYSRSESSCRRGPPQAAANWLPALGGLAFVFLAVLQNIARATVAPTNDARASSIIAHYTEHRAVFLVLAASVVLGAFVLALFVGGLWTRLARDEGRSWAQTGILGVTGIFAIFPLLVACEVALLVITERSPVGDEAVEALWAMHNAVFVVNMSALGVATLGLSLAAVRTRLLPEVFKIIGPLGAVLLAVGSLAGPQIAAGGAKPLFGLSGIGYLIWLTVVATSLGPAHAHVRKKRS